MLGSFWKLLTHLNKTLTIYYHLVVNLTNLHLYGLAVDELDGRDERIAEDRSFLARVEEDGVDFALDSQS